MTTGLESRRAGGPHRLKTCCRTRDRLPAEYVRSRVRAASLDLPQSRPCALLRPSFSVMSNSDSSAQGFADRVQSFVTENKRAILIGIALAVAAGGVVLYASASSSPKASRDKKDKKKSGKSKSRDAESSPVIEEVPVEDQPSKSLSFVHFDPGCGGS